MSSPDELLLLFQSMGTTDHETLEHQFMQVVSSDDSDSCRFFLEANNWNLQASIASYYDAGSTAVIAQQRHPPEMELVADVTVDNKEYMGPGTPFRQSWRIRNPGFQMYFGEAMWVVLNVVQPGMAENIDDVERERLRLEEEHRLDALIGSFAHMQSENTVCSHI